MKYSPDVLFANLINFDDYNNDMDKFTKLSDKNKEIISNIIIALLNMQ